jgi:hypothetical protein
MGFRAVTKTLACLEKSVRLAENKLRSIFVGTFIRHFNAVDS